jgi:hypothetical protein
MIIFMFGDHDLPKVKKGTINWDEYIKHSIKAAKEENTIECPYIKKKADYPTYNLVSKNHCQSHCFGEGCNCMHLCWGGENETE